jgi:hypothetical protein
MSTVRMLAVLAVLAVGAGAALAADDIVDAIEQARTAYEAGDLAGAKRSLDHASQLIGRKNAEGFAALLPTALPGWKAGKVQTSAIGGGGLGASSASRTYTGPKGERVEVQITGDSALLGQFASLLDNPLIAGAMGKIVRIGEHRAIQSGGGDVHMVVANKFLVMATGSAAADVKLAYVQAVDVAKLDKM